MTNDESREMPAYARRRLDDGWAVRKAKYTLYLSLLALTLSSYALLTRVFGCGFLETQAGAALSDVQGWDLSACVESSCGRRTCFELFRDNEREILGGQSTIEIISAELLGDAGTNGEG